MRQKPTPLTDAAVRTDKTGNAVMTGKVNGRELLQSVKAKSTSVRRQLKLYKKLFADLG